MKRSLNNETVFCKGLWNNIFVTIILTIGLRIQTKEINGVAIEGYKEDGIYYLLTYDLVYVETTGIIWYSNLILTISTLVLWLLSGSGIIFFILAYGFPFAKKVNDERSDYNKRFKN
ncbi:hypothetical protein K7I13_11460 [Brucepastera parasyntrophica]|uniref:hypothetical protein n=1 Tax=Brucepastera parasyntrophica TaxID=2880008 RepID=UPI002108AEE4|nr:hypothetical protein [Brucepastera parasyntrophica]ULQ59118.1 hypothetical protein K7I13_11460 [Brucepastera parasyntrophica]